MNTIIGNNPVNRLTEVLAGSTAFLADAAGATSALPSSGDLLDGVDLTGAVADAAEPDRLSTLPGSIPLGGIIGGDPVPADPADIIGGGLTGAGTPGLALAGEDGLLQPIFDAANAAVLEFHRELVTLADSAGAGEIVKAATIVGETAGPGFIGTPTNASDGVGNLVTDVVNLPDTIVSGHAEDLIPQLGSDLTDIVGSAMDLKDAIIFGNDPSNPLPEIIGSIGSAVQHIPLLTINGGNNAGDGGLLGGSAGSVSGSSSGHLVDLDIGPTQTSGGLALDLLSAPQGGPHHAVEVNLLDVGPNGPQLLDLGVLTGGGDGVNVPLLSGGGLDSLAGNVLGGDLLGGSTGATTSGSTSAPAATALLDPVSDLLALDSGGTDHGLLNSHGTHII